VVGKYTYLPVLTLEGESIQTLWQGRAGPTSRPLHHLLEYTCACCPTYHSFGCRSRSDHSYGGGSKDEPKRRDQGRGADRTDLRCGTPVTGGALTRAQGALNRPVIPVGSPSIHSIPSHPNPSPSPHLMVLLVSASRLFRSIWIHDIFSFLDRPLLTSQKTESRPPSRPVKASCV
jgi:hypothetical protein